MFAFFPYFSQEWLQWACATICIMSEWVSVWLIMLTECVLITFNLPLERIPIEKFQPYVCRQQGGGKQMYSPLFDPPPGGGHAVK